MNYSPLRYPGGKNKLSAFIAKICEKNNLTEHYVEPYCGGAAVALFLLMNGYVKKVTINDKDRSIYSFWYSILHYSDEFIYRIRNTDISLSEWDNQRAIQNNKEKENLMDLGFSSFFMNRTNRSGIIMGGMIGGRNQTSPYKIDCRFNKEELIERIKRIAEIKDSIIVKNDDALDVIKAFSTGKEESSLVYLDPPYFKKADSLYLNHYQLEDHKAVSLSIVDSDLSNWLVSYDNAQEIKDLYPDVDKIEYSFKHTAYDARIGKEILFFSESLKSEVLKDRNPTKYKHEKRGGKMLITYKGSPDALLE
ncbi:DNA adenine methylase [Imperialibacter roseus]|uniref:site-specific DNA-methyltransferase (adenine-specific) n=1 Tax=Imperialibacter roseus TaxID=1324217 RepID=A0ABZ0IIK7_9BACT|nr:DNA adenine methylase [Imperialibacter roseus]WOK04376.1 DNA adenine methylase [Imperialibacter roseus]